MGYIVAIDQGTTGTTVLVLDLLLNPVSRANVEFPQHYPQPGWVEHHPDELWRSVLTALSAALQNIDASQIISIGITNQRETTVVWERASSEPIYPAIVWQCRRTEPLCQALRDQGLGPSIQHKTGLVLDPYFSATKLRWILDHTDSHARAQNGDLCFGTIDTFLTWRLTQGRAHVTDPSNASRTLLMDLSSLSWDPDLLSTFQIPPQILPSIRSNAEIYGHTLGVPGLPDGIPISGMAGDQQAALFGQACFNPGDAKCTYGTGAFLLMNTGPSIIRSQNNLLSTVAWRIGDATTYALEGSTFIAGAAVQWLRDGLQIITSASDIEPLAATVPDSGGVVFVPALTGLGAPHWRADARGVLWGITRGTTRAHIARATLDGIAHQCADLLLAMQSDLGSPLRTLKVDGGASANALLMQTQADLLDCPLSRPLLTDTTALGAATLSAIGVGALSDLPSIAQSWRADASFSPSISPQQRAQARTLWSEGLKRA
jgi:glycerol kinase